jgi:hypothetical protein
MEVTADDSRGAGAAINASRSVRVLNRMTKEEAMAPKIGDEQRKLYLRVSRDKANMAPPSKAKWFHLANVDIGNATTEQPSDQVQAAERWEYPSAFEDLSIEHIHFMRDEVRRQSYRTDPRSVNWVGKPLIKHLGLNPTDQADRKRASEILKTWFANGVLAPEVRMDEHRHEKEFVIPGNWRDEEAEVLQPNLL